MKEESGRNRKGKMVTLDTILDLVGTLDDTPGDNTPSHRFRSYLAESVTSTGTLRDYIEACLRQKGSQYDKALQDLVNHAASLLGFEVEYGRYRGTVNAIGFDGVWSRNDFHIVAEVKTTDAFSIPTTPLVGYVDALISEGRIPDWDHALGLYIFGRADQDRLQLANTVVAEKRTNQLRIVTIDSILSLAEMVQEARITTDEAISLLRPGGVFVEDTVQLLSRVAAEADVEPSVPQIEKPPRPTFNQVQGRGQEKQKVDSEQIYLMTPVSDQGNETAESIIRGLVEHGWYVMRDGTPGLKRLEPGDRICFYQSSVGIVADAEVSSRPELKQPPQHISVREPEKYRWRFQIVNPRFYFGSPVVIDENLRESLDAFSDKDPSKPWSWFVQGTRYLTRRDFDILTSSENSGNKL